MKIKTLLFTTVLVSMSINSFAYKEFKTYFKKATKGDCCDEVWVVVCEIVDGGTSHFITEGETTLGFCCSDDQRTYKTSKPAEYPDLEKELNGPELKERWTVEINKWKEKQANKN